MAANANHLGPIVLTVCTRHHLPGHSQDTKIINMAPSCFWGHATHPFFSALGSIEFKWTSRCILLDSSRDSIHLLAASFHIKTGHFVTLWCNWWHPNVLVQSLVVHQGPILGARWTVRRWLWLLVAFYWTTPIVSVVHQSLASVQGTMHFKYRNHMMQI